MTQTSMSDNRRPLRIAFFVTNFPKLSEIFLLNQALALQERGHEVHIYALTTPREATVQPGTERIPPERIHVAGMPRAPLARLALLPGLLRRNSPGEACAALNPLRQGAEAITLRALFRLDAVREGLPPFDVVHAQLGSVARQCVLLKTLGHIRSPLVVSFRGSDLSRYLAFGAPGAYRGVFREAAFCLPVAKRWIEPLVGLGCPREKIRHLPSGIPVARIPARSLDGWGDGDFPRVLSACRLEPYKGIRFGLEAFRLLLARCPKARYDVFGDGPERASLEARAQRLGIADRVHWHGASPHAAILEALGKSDLHWFTTVTGRDGRTEGVPNILKESQAAGVPAVAFDHPGVDEVVAAGETALVVPERDVAALAAASLTLVGDPARARRMGDLARVRARQTFDLKRLTDRLEGIYRAAVGLSAS